MKGTDKTWTENRWPSLAVTGIKTTLPIVIPDLVSLHPTDFTSRILRLTSPVARSNVSSVLIASSLVDQE